MNVLQNLFVQSQIESYVYWHASFTNFSIITFQKVNEDELWNIKLDRAAELQAEVRSAIRVLHGWCPRPPQGHRGDTVLMSPQTQMRGNHRNGGPTQQPPPATVVVSSTSSMRPPPPPPPPRARASTEGKGHHEEPTSSIPDLEEHVFSFFKKRQITARSLCDKFGELSV
ncbi:hypothetical protein WN51_07609 [Melipona quadrifasciata]|uniref:Uncharacterized protein n=1 Tax=Melipona quadrifasciata TaxID=166423 RepID=A0A0N0BBS6_9HYME|nr:hypothetical protein WN51_07609 [Melipona quadrifasciata]